MSEKLFKRFLKILKFPCSVGKTRLKSRGLFFFLFVVFVGAIAVNSGNNLVYLTFSTILSFVPLSGLLSFSNLKNIEAEVKAPQPMFANRKELCFITLKNSGNFPKFKIHMKIMGENVYTDIIKDTFSSDFECRFPRRGIHKVGALILTSDFPFGFFERHKTVLLDSEIIVCPEVTKVKVLHKGSGAENFVSNAVRGEGSEFYSAREYIDGEDSRKINWKLTAKADKPIVIETEKESKKMCKIFLDTSIYAYRNEEEFEDALKKITSLVYSCFNEGAEIFFFTPRLRINAKPDDNNTGKIFRFLATVSAEDRPPHKGVRGFITHREIAYV